MRCLGLQNAEKKYFGRLVAHVALNLLSPLLQWSEEEKKTSRRSWRHSSSQSHLFATETKEKKQRKQWQVNGKHKHRRKSRVMMKIWVWLWKKLMIKKPKWMMHDCFQIVWEKQILCSQGSPSSSLRPLLWILFVLCCGFFLSLLSVRADYLGALKASLANPPLTCTQMEIKVCWLLSCLVLLCAH